MTNVLTFSLRSRRLRHGLLLSAVFLAIAGYAPGDAAEGPYPGLPRHAGVGTYVGIAQSGISEAAKAKQWAKIPLQATAAYTKLVGTTYPPDDALGRQSITEFTNYVYFVAPVGSEHNYGISPRFSVRTVAFGAIPVEATLQLLQRREKDGLPVPIVASANTLTYQSGRITDGDTVINDEVTLRVARLVVDGVDLGLSTRCQTVGGGKLTLFGKGWRRFIDPADPNQPWLTGNYSPAQGGILNGTVDVPSFSGCLAANGEDVSQLLTSTISGPGNAVKLNVGNGFGCSRPIPPATSGTGPPQPGESSVEAAGCRIGPAFLGPEIPLP